MGLLKIEGITHWSIPVKNLDESEKFYGDLLGLKGLGRLGNSRMSCFNVDNQNILLCERGGNVDKSFKEKKTMAKFMYYDLETTGVKFWKNGIHQMRSFVMI